MALFLFNTLYFVSLYKIKSAVARQFYVFSGKNIKAHLRNCFVGQIIL